MNSCSDVTARFLWDSSQMNSRQLSILLANKEVRTGTFSPTGTKKMLTEVLVSSDNATSFSQSLGHLLALSVDKSHCEKPCGH